MIVWKFLYNSIVLPVLWVLIQILGLFNAKVRRGIEGRRGLLASLEKAALQLHGTRRLWFHSSSMGEFEQAKPIITALKKKYPSLDIVVTFFSPSGYEHSKSYKPANIVSYIPFDFASDMRRFIQLIRPTVAIMVRYDVWPNAIWELEKAKIPVFIASATMKKNSPRKLPLIREFHRRLYGSLSHILTVSESDVQSFRDFGELPCVVEAAGDTRFDQVVMRREDAMKRRALPQSVTDGRRVLVIGQSWEADDDVVVPALFELQQSVPSLLTILVPHEPGEEYLASVEKRLEGKLSCIRLSELAGYAGEQTILVDSVGGLVALYQHAEAVYVGGSFKQGVHNVLEPAIF
ncbi:MAG: 3-deoxy-D-manno-octulosonic acid transferase, partial [Ignavibacteriales bacterium]|nr:3-deoxy-D-manno-octulosonic acid transferase [Ignavibacteriales bacterium]